MNIQTATESDFAQVSELFRGLDAHHAHLDNMFVVPESRTSGVATALMRESVEWCLQRGVTKIELQVYNVNRRALDLYESLGFRPYLSRMELELDQGRTP